MEAWLFPYYAPSRELAILDTEDILFPWRLRHAAKRRQPQEWRQSINVRGFDPSEVSVKAEDGKVRVKARHEQGEDVTEIQRTVQVPNNVQADKISTHFTQDGVLVVRGPFKEPEVAKGDSVWDEVRQLLRGPELGNAEANIVDGEDGLKKYKAEVSVREYKPDEVRVRQNGNCVIVEAEHKDERDGQRVHRRLERAFQLPEGTQVDHLVSRLSHDGRLCIEAPYQPPALKDSKESEMKDVAMEIEKEEQPQK